MDGRKGALEQPQFSTDARDNGRLLVIVSALSESALPVAKRVVEQFRNLPPFLIPDNREAAVSVRVLASVPSWVKDKNKNEQILQRSKLVACFLGVASCEDADELTKANVYFNREVSQMGSNVLSNVFVVFGPENRLGTQLRGMKGNVFLLDQGLSTVGKAKEEERADPQDNQLLQLLFKCLGQLQGQLAAMQCKDEDYCRSIAKRLEGNITVTDEETQRHLRARSLKSLADLELMRGQLSSAVRHYLDAHATFKHIKDYQWMGAALEGVLSAALLLRTSSEDFSRASDALLQQVQVQARAEDVGTVSETDFHNGLMEKSDSSAQPIACLDHGNTSEDGEEGKGDNEIDLAGPPEDVHQLLHEENLEKTYHSVLTAYSKVSVPLGGRMHVEFLMKFASFLAERKKKHKVCQRMVEIVTLVSNDQVPFQSTDRPCAYLVLAGICKMVGLQRKSLFMIREAIEISQELKFPGIGLTQQAYDLLQMCLSDYHLCDPQKPLIATQQGWPLLQANLLLKYVRLCKILKRDNLVISWGWFLLQHFYSHLTAKELKSLVESIAECTRAVSTIDAPFPMRAVPYVTVFKPQPLAPQLAVKQSRSLFKSAMTSIGSSAKGPFLVSMIGRRKKNEMAVTWAQGDPAEVFLMISNPLPFELRVERMCMILEGAEVTTYPSSIMLPPSCEPQQFVLLCIPNQPGSVSLTGYQATFLGLYNKCLWRQTDGNINVLPSLPQLRAKIFPIFPSDRMDVSLSVPPIVKRRSGSTLDYFELLDGEVCKCEFQFQSIGDVPVDHMRISLMESTSDYCHFVWDDSDADRLLPFTEKNKSYTFFCQVQAQIPAYLRVGSYKTLPLGVHIQSLLSYDPASVLTMQGQHTMPRRFSTQEEGIPSIKRNSSSLYQYKRPSKVASPPTHSPLMESLDLPEPPKAAGNGFHSGRQHWTMGNRTLGRPTSEHHQQVQQSPLHQLIRSTHTGSNNSSPRGSAKKKLKEFLKKNSVEHSLPNSPSRAVAQQPSCRTSDARLMDSLNLELALTEELTPRSGQNLSSNASSKFSRSGSAGEMELDKVSSDQMSLKSDPGTIPASESYPMFASPSPPTIATPSVKQLSSTMPVGESAQLASQERRTLSVDKSSTSKPQKWKKGGPVATARHRAVDGMRSVPLISPPTGPVVKAVRRPPERKLIKTTFLVEYTGGEGSKEGYYREVTMEIAMTVRPTVVFDAFFVSSVKRSVDLFSFAFNMENISPYPLEVTFDINQDGLREPSKTWFMDATENRKVTLHLKKFTVPDAEPNDVKPYSKRLVELIQISWTQEDQAKTGSLALTGLQLPLSALHIMRPLPVLYDTSLCQGRVPIPPDQIVAPGSSVELRVQLTNNSGQVLSPSLAILDPSLGEDGGQHQPRPLKGMVIASPSLVHRIPRLPMDGAYTFVVSLLFLYQGNYFINIKHYAIKSRPSLSSTSTSPPSSPASLQSDSRVAKDSVSSVVGHAPTLEAVPNTLTVPVLPVTCSSIRINNLPSGNRTAAPTPVAMESSLPFLNSNASDEAIHDIQMFVSRSQSYLGPCVNVHVSYALHK